MFFNLRYQVLWEMVTLINMKLSNSCRLELLRFEFFVFFIYFCSSSTEFHWKLTPSSVSVALNSMFTLDLTSCPPLWLIWVFLLQNVLLTGRSCRPVCQLIRLQLSAAMWCLCAECSVTHSLTSNGSNTSPSTAAEKDQMDTPTSWFSR